MPTENNISKINVETLNLSVSKNTNVVSFGDARVGRLYIR